jgi:hypothetical protein
MRMPFVGGCSKIRWYQAERVDAIPIPPRTRMTPLTQVSVSLQPLAQEYRHAPMMRRLRTPPSSS